MANAGYEQYGQNPYSGGTGGYGQSDPYGQAEPASGYSGYGASNPYGTTSAQPTTTHSTGADGATPSMQEQGYAAPPPPPAILSNQDFLSRVEGVRSDIRQLTSNVAQIGTLHQRSLNSTDNAESAQLQNIVSKTQVLNTRIKDQIKYLEADSTKSGKNTTKNSQIRTLKGHFTDQLQQYQQEEVAYKKRYQDQIARQYKIVNPEASEAEVQEASTADWGNEGIFQQALKTNRTGAATTVLGAVRARHNDLQNIERTLIELAALFDELAAAVEVQEPMVAQAEEQTHKVTEDQKAANQHIDKGIRHARSRRKLKWIMFGIVVLIIVILALVLGLYFGLNNKKNNNNNNGTK